MTFFLKCDCIPILMVIASKWMGDKYHMESKGFKFKDTRTTSGNDDITFLNDSEIVGLVIEKIKNLNIGKLFKLCSVIEVFHAQNNVKINILSSRQKIEDSIKYGSRTLRATGDKYLCSSIWTDYFVCD